MSDSVSLISESSVYEALSRSERIINGSVVLDWRQLPSQVIAGLPEPPLSAKKHLQRLKKKHHDKHHRHHHHHHHLDDASHADATSNVEWEEDVSRTVFPIEKATQLLPTKVDGKLQESNEEDLKKKTNPVEEEKQYTFNNCHFTYIRPDQLTANGTEELLKVGVAANLPALQPPAVEPIPTVANSVPASIPIQNQEAKVATSNEKEIVDVAPQPVDAATEKPLDVDDISNVLETLRRINGTASISSIQHADLGVSAINKQLVTKESVMSVSELSARPPLIPTSAVYPEPIATQTSSPFASTNNNESIDSKHRLRFETPGDPKTLRKTREDLLAAQAELASLARDIHLKSRLVKQQQLELASERKNIETREAELETKSIAANSLQRKLRLMESKVKEEVDLLVVSGIKTREEELKRDTEVLIRRYEESLEMLGKENKRVQVSLKEMVVTNRHLRDQVPK